MRHIAVWSIASVVVLWVGVAYADLNQLLSGDYAFTGSASCVVSNAGFDANLTPLEGFRAAISFSVRGVRTFNGDGTGTVQGRTVSIQNPDATGVPGGPSVPGGASSSDFRGTFAYEVSPDGTFTTQLIGPLTSTTVTPTIRAGQTFETTNFPKLSGQILPDHKTLTLASEEPTVEVVKPVPPTVANTQFRICHRSRILLRQ